VIAELIPARHRTEPYAYNTVEADHGGFEARLRPMRGRQTIGSLRTIAAAHAFVQDLRRGGTAIAAATCTLAVPVPRSSFASSTGCCRLPTAAR
jgi:transposase, IS6 family